MVREARRARQRIYENEPVRASVPKRNQYVLVISRDEQRTPTLRDREYLR